MRFLILQLFFILLCVGTSRAENSFLFGSEEASSSLYKQFEDKALSSPDWSIHQHFRSVFSELKAGDYASLSESIEELKFVTSSRGYSDLPDYSLELLRNAAVEKDPFNVEFLVEKAVYLSPSDSRVALTAASFYKVIGIGKSFGLLFKSLTLLACQPLFLSAIMLNLVIVALVSFTISIFLTYFIQMLRNSNNFRELLVPLMPWKFRGLISVFALILLYTVPFMGGLLIVLSAWGLCLAATISKRYLLIVGILCVSWGWALPRIAIVSYHLNDPSSRVFEDLNLSRFSPKAEQYLQSRLATAPNDGTALFFLAQSFRLKGFSDSARTLFDKIESLPGVEPELRKVGQANLGVVAFDSGEYTEAQELLSQAESGGMKGFELYYNLAITNLLLLDTDEYNRYYNMAKEIDPARVSQIVTEKYSSPKAILIPISNTAMIGPLFKPLTGISSTELGQIDSKINDVTKILIGNLRLDILMLLGSLMALSTFGFKSKKSQIRSASIVWVFFPFGRYIASNQIVFGIVGLGILFSLILLAPSGFLNLYGNFSGFQSIYNEFLLLALLVMLVFQVLSYYTIRAEPNAR